ncbi:hypothetical protein [Seinonella peptonophila]|uniref:hypothetical protein n=1 Tax=Seinonella peptonophila TaxID=112248 RepID=UPI00111485AD|nr:hypothetical protein [Seinonella peptonophila]
MSTVFHIKKTSAYSAEVAACRQSKSSVNLSRFASISGCEEVFKAPRLLAQGGINSANASNSTTAYSSLHSRGYVAPESRSAAKY